MRLNLIPAVSDVFERSFLFLEHTNFSVVTMANDGHLPTVVTPSYLGESFGNVNTTIEVVTDIDEAGMKIGAD